MPKTLKGRTLWDFTTSILLQSSQKIEGKTLWRKKIEKEPHSTEKHLKCGIFGLVRYCMLGRKPFFPVPWSNKYVLTSYQNFVELLVELIWSLQAVFKNTHEEPLL